MTTVKTSAGWIVVHHCHIADADCGKEEITDEEVEWLRERLRLDHPDAVAVGRATTEYNCHGFALASRHGWFCDARRFLSDDYKRASFSSPQLGDVVIYFDPDYVEPAHTAVVIEVDGNTITRVRSKWAEGLVVEHDLRDVRPKYGEPELLRRRKPGIPVIGEIMTKSGSVDIDDELRQSIINRAVASISDPDVHRELLYASTPEVARSIIKSLPGVGELLLLGPDAGRTALRLLEHEETAGKRQIASIALYLLQQAPVEEAISPLAKSLRAGRFTGINTALAAGAFLNAANIDAVSEDPITVAIREAERFA